MTSNETRRALRTVVQFAVGVGPMLPAMLAQPGMAEAAPLLVPAAAIAGVAARVMAIPAVQRRIPRWLQVPLDPDAELARLARRDRS